MSSVAFWNYACLIGSFKLGQLTKGIFPPNDPTKEQDHEQLRRVSSFTAYHAKGSWHLTSSTKSYLNLRTNSLNAGSESLLVSHLSRPAQKWDQMMRFMCIQATWQNLYCHTEVFILVSAISHQQAGLNLLWKVTHAQGLHWTFPFYAALYLHSVISYAFYFLPCMGSFSC